MKRIVVCSQFEASSARTLVSTGIRHSGRTGHRNPFRYDDAKRGEKIARTSVNALPAGPRTSLIFLSHTEKNVDSCDAFMCMNVTLVLDVAEDTCRRSTMDWERTGIDLATHRFGCPSYHPSAKAETRATVKEALTYMAPSGDKVCGSCYQIKCFNRAIWCLEWQLSFP